MIPVLKTESSQLPPSFARAKPYLAPGLFFLGLIGLALVGVLFWLNKGDWIYPDQVQAVGVFKETLGGSTAIGQTFVAYQGGLEAIEVKLSLSDQQSDQPLILHLRERPQATQDIRQITISSAALADGSWARFTFDPLPNSRLQYSYFFIEAPQARPEDEIGLYYGPPESYLDGVLYLNGQPQEAQLAFRLVYNRPAMLWELIRSVLAAIPVGIAIGLVFIIPGWALWILLKPKGDYHWAEVLALAIGFSLALYPVLMLWTNIIGLQLGPLYVWLPVTLGAGVLLWRYQPWRVSFDQVSAILRNMLSATTFWPDVTLIIVILIIAMGRFLMVRNLTMPLWHDSVQHTVIVQRILESGGLFQSWEPYTPYRTFSNQFGFHVDIAIWQWLTGLALPQAMLLGGQIFNLFAVLALYPLAYRIRGPWAGLVTVLVAGTLTQFPNFYTNWGRYPQLAGQVILPIAAWWVWIVLSQDKPKCGLITCILGGSLLAAGMALVYYRMVFHYLAFVVAASLIVFQPAKLRSNKSNWLILMAMMMIMGVLISPWLYQILFRPLEASASVKQSVQRETIGFWQQLLTIHIGWPASQAVVVFLGTLIAIRIGGVTALPVVWLWALVGLPILRLTPLWGVNIIQEFTITTSLYIPLTLIWGVFVGYLIQQLVARNKWLSGLVIVSVITIGLWKLPSLAATANRAFDLSSSPDIQAARWIKENLPEEAMFLINGIIYTDGVSVIAGDAGSWLPILSGRAVVIPPQYALLAERPNTPNYIQAVNEIVALLFDVSPTAPESKRAICAFPQPITHVYLGQHRGMVDEALPFPPPHPMLPAELLIQDPDFHLIYHQDRVMIFEFDRAVCV